jgi:hypothetical protein
LLLNILKVCFTFPYLFQLFAFQLKKLTERLKQTGPKLKSKGEEAFKPALEQEVHCADEVYSGTVCFITRSLSNGVLISGCQTNQTSTHATTAQGVSFGALSNAIQTILADKHGQVTNKLGSCDETT